MEVVELPLDLCFITVPIALPNIDYPAVVKDITDNGLHFPVQIVHCTANELRLQKQRYKTHMVEIPKGYADSDEIYAVWGGSNRVDIARKAGYNSIDCVVYAMDLKDKFGVARKAQEIQRRPFANLYKTKARRKRK